MQQATRILIGDDHELIRRGLRQVIERHSEWEICGEAASGAEIMECATKFKPDIVIIDVNMPETDAVGLTRHLKQTMPECEILVFTMHEGEELMCALIAAGARGYVLKSDPTSDVVAAIESLRKHLPYFTGKVSQELSESFLKSVKGERSRFPSAALSVREREIVQLLAEGKANKQVAAILGISVKTVETHRATIMHKLDANSIVELVHYAMRNNIIST
jgi:DNA-binding NarL/FixJ family response regulator